LQFINKLVKYACKILPYQKIKSLENFIPNVDLSNFYYELPDNRIAVYPLEHRESSKLLVYRNNGIEHHYFKEISGLIPENSLLVFNETKVIPARLMFKKDNGAVIEILLILPVWPDKEISKAMKTKKKCIWSCLVGNFKKWKNNQILSINVGNRNSFNLQARIANRELGHIEFGWDTDISFAECVEVMGNVPLPPYIKREPENSDKERYQTIYSLNPGAVAAPTAGLHFTRDIISELRSRNIETDYLTLHVSAGTFQPIKHSNVPDHPMQNEQIVIRSKNIDKLAGSEKIIPVGTTSMRTIESLYWYGVKLKAGDPVFRIEKLFPYKHSNTKISLNESLREVKNYMLNQNIDTLHGETEIFIIPGYKFRVSAGLITNFHLPKSTLILLVAAFIGDHWRKIYNEALKSGYRFLSYGDTSLLLP